MIFQFLTKIIDRSGHGKMRQMRQLKKGGDIVSFLLNIRFIICAFRQIDFILLNQIGLVLEGSPSTEIFL